jgi:hypothetical protein
VQLLLPYSCLNETEILFDLTNKCTVVTDEKSEFLEITQYYFKKHIKASALERIQSDFKLAKSIPFFKEFDTASLLAMVTKFQVIYQYSNTVIAVAGKEPNSLQLLYEGSLKVIKNINGKTIEVGELSNAIIRFSDFNWNSGTTKWH